ncbi:MAG: helix-turn-helix domain-containing protein [Thermorudis peleae]|nr:helix-turn-helix domain-containing protein [Thermorudis peleae]
MTDARLTAKQRLFAAALAAGASVQQAAARAGVSERTGIRWHHDPRVQALVEQHLAQAEAMIVTGLVAGAAEAVTVLRAALREPDRKLAVKAADRLVSHYLAQRLPEPDTETLAQAVVDALMDVLRELGLSEHQAAVRRLLADALRRGGRS